MKHHRSLSSAHPEQLPQYNAGARTGPGSFNLELSAVEEIRPEVVKQAHLRDFAWFLARLPSAISTALGATVQDQQIPPWSGFNAILSASEVPPESRIGYLPIINASPTELGTVRKVLENAVAIAKEMKQDDIVVVFDLAIYAKAQEILWKSQSADTSVFSNVVVRLGSSTRSAHYWLSLANALVTPA